jgi:hypothetical protein
MNVAHYRRFGLVLYVVWTVESAIPKEASRYVLP